MAKRLLHLMAFALLLALAVPAGPAPARAAQYVPPPPEVDTAPRLPAGPLSGKVGSALLVDVRKDPKDMEYPFSLETLVLEAPAGAKLDVELETHALFLQADKPGDYAIRVRGFQQRSVG